jgi:hypothetical protein
MYQGPIFWAADPMQWFGGAWAPFATNKTIRRIQTDSLYIPPGLIATNGANCELWSKPLSDGTTALFFINRSNFNETISFNLSAVGIAPGTSAVFTNVWAYTNCSMSGSWTNYMPSNSVQLWQMNPNPTPSPFTQFTLSNYNTVLGSNNNVTGVQDTIYGYNNTSQSSEDTIYGANDTATGPSSLVLGYNENDGGWNSSVMIGTSAGAGDTATYYGQIRFWNDSPYTSLWLEGNEVWSNNTFFGHLASSNVVAGPWLYTNFGHMAFGPFYTNLTGFNAEVDITFGVNVITNTSGLADQIIVYDPNAPAGYSPWTNFVGCANGATNSTNLMVPQWLPPGGYLTVHNQDAGLSGIQTNRIVAH